ncbi:hypothetical protein LY78DRAFT_585505, partial [Colletotrichum sublineola]
DGNSRNTTPLAWTDSGEAGCKVGAPLNSAPIERLCDIETLSRDATNTSLQDGNTRTKPKALTEKKTALSI